MAWKGFCKNLFMTFKTYFISFLIHVSVLLISSFSHAIVNGKEAQKLSTFGKSVVFIILQNEAGLTETCTGSFISPHHILTAAHCVTADSEDTTITLGVHPIENESELKLTIAKIFLHPKYNKESLDRNDLAIIKINETYKNNKYIFRFPVDIDNLLRFNKFDPTLTAIGYGENDGIDGVDNTDSVGILRYVKLSSYLTKDQNLILDQSTGGGVCFGDSGGALTLRLRKIKYIVGVSSGVFDDSKMAVRNDTEPIDFCKEKSIFMNVIYYLPWIKSTMAL
jgi:secreted trypsin-like serine protease